MGSDPGHAAQKHDHQQGNGPDDELDAAGIDKLRPVGGSRVGGTKPPGEAKGRGNRRHHDREHDGEAVDQDCLLGNPDDTLRVEDGRLTRRQDDRHREGGVACGPGADRSVAPRARFATCGSVRPCAHRNLPSIIAEHPAMRFAGRSATDNGCRWLVNL